MLPLGQIIRRIERRWQRAATLNRLYDAGPAATYAGLLHYARVRNYDPSWAAHSFREIFGTWPRPRDRKGEPTALPDFLIEEWIARRKRPQPRRKRPQR
jgi:hypothetical protein